MSRAETPARRTEARQDQAPQTETRQSGVPQTGTAQAQVVQASGQGGDGGGKRRPPGYDGVLLDLDGTVVRGALAVPGASEVVSTLRQRGLRVQFVTNNASRAPEEVAEHLTALGVAARPEEVLTSAQAAVAMLAARVPAGSPVLVVGTEALAAAVRAAGLRPVSTVAEEPAAVVQGHSPDTGWTRLAEACLAIRAGALWVACNIDRTLPTERGLLPGNGAMVAALRAATDRSPLVAGKPEAPLFQTAVQRTGAARALVVGDRLDTDIAGARCAGLESLLVLTGVADAAGLLAAPPQQRPDYLAADVRALCEPLDSTRIAPPPGWQVDITAGRVTVRGDGVADGRADPVTALRALCSAWWREHSGAPAEVRAGDDVAAEALDAIGLGAR